MNSIGCQMDKGAMNWEDVSTMAKKGEGNWRPAAIRLLRTIENPDMADFEPVLEGQESLRESRGSGHDTSLIKKCKTKRRIIPQGKDKDPIEEVEREIELHDRSGVDFDRAMDRTEGKPAQRIVGDTGGPLEVIIKVVRGVSSDEL